jgi:hypothetical protein
MPGGEQCGRKYKFGYWKGLEGRMGEGFVQYIAKKKIRATY